MGVAIMLALFGPLVALATASITVPEIASSNGNLTVTVCAE